MQGTHPLDREVRRLPAGSARQEQMHRAAAGSAAPPLSRCRAILVLDVGTCRLRAACCGQAVDVEGAGLREPPGGA